MPGGPTINLTSENEHVLEIYCRIRVVKEIEIRVRQSIPFNRIPRLFLIYIIFVSVKMINNFPTKGGTSTVYSPNIIMSGETFHYNIHLTLKIGHYCQVHDEDTPWNSQADRKRSSILLGPSGNTQGGFKFMSLHSAKKIIRRIWDAIQMLDTVISRVNELTKGKTEHFIFIYQKWRIIGDSELIGVDKSEKKEPPKNQLLDDIEATPP